MEPGADITKAQEQENRVRKRSGWLVAVIVFLAVYAICVASFEHWGLALGWLPSGLVAAAFGWIVYCLPWLLDVIVVLIELLAALG